MPPEKNRIAGELRLRITSTDNPASFESGSDLLRIAWSRPLTLALFVLSNSYSPLYEKLREEQLVPDDLHEILSKLPSKSPRYRKSQLLYTLSDTFVIDFSIPLYRFLVVTKQDVVTLPFHYHFFDKREMCKGAPYIGAYTNLHFSIIILMNFRKCLGSI
jgi:hypothetical protein